MASQYSIEIKLVGEDITLTTSSRDVGELISEIEQMVDSIIARDNPALGIHESEVIVTPVLENTPLIESKTTLYGTLIGIGGENPPRARLRLLNGNIFSCSVTEGDDFRVARELGERLYSVVVVRGTAKWDARDMSLQHFIIEQLTSYKLTSVEQALTSLHDIAGKYYEEVEDIDEIVADIRGNDEDF